VLKKVRPGLYERTDAPKKVKISPQFAEVVRQGGQSTLLTQIVEQAERGGGKVLRTTRD
jgi:hypothetical protein